MRRRGGSRISIQKKHGENWAKKRSWRDTPEKGHERRSRSAGGRANFGTTYMFFFLCRFFWSLFSIFYFYFLSDFRFSISIFYFFSSTRWCRWKNGPGAMREKTPKKDANGEADPQVANLGGHFFFFHVFFNSIFFLFFFSLFSISIFYFLGGHFFSKHSIIRTRG